ncbi:MAG: SGNH/GDSL hydrolase family protein [Muribaculaceae bacterium]|nr:SGNH/GDSL hydrolase family protein [Muribaculaceae bacterium]
MKRPYIELWLLLALSLLLITILSSFENIEIFGFELKKASIYEELVADNGNTTLIENNDTNQVIIDKIEKEIEKDTLPKSILFIGDSMLEGLGPRMASYAKHNGHTLNNVIWYSSTSKVWGECDTLSYFIHHYKPNYIIVSLGANELFVKDIINKRAKYVDRILSQIGDIPYIWIGPPNWKDDSGINKLVASRAKRGTFFLTDGMQFDRAKDGAHPTRSSSVLWMDSVVRWINIHSIYPIKLDVPENKTDKANHTVILQPKK